MENVLQIPRITNTTIQYFVDGEFIDNVTVDEVNKIRENVLEYIVNTKDISILNRFYFIGHKDTNDGKMGEEVKMTLSIRFRGIDDKGVASYLLSLYCSAAILADDAIAVLEDVEVGEYYDYDAD